MVALATLNLPSTRMRLGDEAAARLGREVWRAMVTAGLRRKRPGNRPPVPQADR